jgi:gliding motility-associated-like protein
VQNLKALDKDEKLFYKIILSVLSTAFINLLCFSSSIAQSCPPNIDFESGNFNGWTCYTGSTAAIGSENVISLSASGGPWPGRHTMYSSSVRGTDPYGGFPVNCPNGSGHSVKLGNSLGGGEAEGMSYEFTIPANENSYSLTYHYAVVFQAPNHRDIEQPRMEIEITNITDNSVIDCASFTFIAVGSTLPGFLVSTQTDTTTVLYKDWSTVSVDLSGNAGKKIRLFFKTADCTFRRHFGYAYIDVDTECGSSLTGSTYCPDDTAVNITAPFGYQKYTWYDSTLTQVLGSDQILRLTPPPPSGKTIAVKLEPFDGFGCTKTFFTKLSNTLVVIANAGHDTLSCNRSPVSVGANPKAGLVYRWLPEEGLSNSEIANPTVTPDKTTTYVISTKSSGGGCLTTDTVIVKASLIDSTLTLIGKAAFCIDNGDSAVLTVNPTTTVQWFKDDAAIFRAQQLKYRVPSSGTYHALITNIDGCSIDTKRQPIAIDKAKPGIRYPVEYAVINLPLTLQARQIGETFLWRPATSLNSGEIFNPVFTGAEERLYTIGITTTTECLTVDTQLVKTIKNVEVFVPTAFTPNMDGKNDYLHPLLRGIKDVRYFRIFNRWGQLLYESRNPQPGWDGTFKGLPQPTSTVVWVLEGVGVDGTVYSRKGTCVLLR